MTIVSTLPVSSMSTESKRRREVTVAHINEEGLDAHILEERLFHQSRRRRCLCRQRMRRREDRGKIVSPVSTPPLSMSTERKRRREEW